jgi:hypothetical protein
MVSAYRIDGQSSDDALCGASYNTFEGTGEGCFSDWAFEPPFTPITETIQIARVVTNATAGESYEIFQRFRSSNEQLVLDSIYIEEITQTAEMISDQNAYVHLLMKSDFNRNPNQPSSSFNEYSWFFNNITEVKSAEDTHTAHLQYGDPHKSAQGLNLSSYDRTGTLDNLKIGNLESSLQAQVLSNGGFLRLHDVGGLVDGSAFLDQFFLATLESIQKCQDVAFAPAVEEDPLPELKSPDLPALDMSPKTDCEILAMTLTNIDLSGDCCNSSGGIICKGNGRIMKLYLSYLTLTFKITQWIRYRRSASCKTRRTYRIEET